MSFDIKLEAGDILVDNNGEVQTVTGTEKLKQDIAKMILTEIGTNVYHPWYGSQLADSVIGRATTADVIARDTELTVNTALENLSFLQTEQTQYQNVTPAEMIAAIKEVRVESEPIDPRQWNVTIVVLSKALTEISEEFSISL
jgi:hypothetical protein